MGRTCSNKSAHQFGDKVELQLEKFGEFPLVTPVVIVTTVNEEGIPNAAIKSWMMPIGGNPNLIIFACSLKHDTARNILETKEFVVNIPNNDIAEQALKDIVAVPPGSDEIREAGLTPIPSVKVKPPRIAECIAHAECKFEELRKYDIGEYGNLFVGRVVHLSVNSDLIEAPDERKYKLLDQMLSYCVDGTLRPDKKRRAGRG